MANTYNSDVYIKGGRERPNGQDNGNKITATITIPAGVALGVGDILNFCRLGENVRITQFALEAGVFDTNAAATLAVDLGITAVSDCLLDGVVIQTNTSGAKTLARVGGEATAIDAFADEPFPVQTTVQSVFATVTAAAATAATGSMRNISLRAEYDYIFPNTWVTGVSDPTYPFAGSKTTAVEVVDNYNGNA